MRAYDLIMKKRNGEILSEKEIKWLIKGYVEGKIPDYQMSAFLMAVYFRGLNEEETLNLTKEMAQSGDMIDLSSIKGIKTDKHSTGGVGDKTTLVVIPIVAACGVPVAKMSGRGLGHTGGTIDKLESIDGFRTSIEKEEFFDIVNKTGLCVIGQTGNIAPADKKMYALRDVTATVDSIPLIAASIMSKKIAAGSDAIVLDVKTGSGAFMKTLDKSIELAETMVKIGNNAGRNTAALITDMDRPLGYAIGNSVEVIEATETLKGMGPEDLAEVALNLAANMLCAAEKGSYEECMEMAKEALKSGKALQKLKDMVKAQGGNPEFLDNYDLFKKEKFHAEVKSEEEGYITAMDTEKYGEASVVLGAGRETKESSIDLGAGIILKVKLGDYVKKGDDVAELLTDKKESLETAEKMIKESMKIETGKPKKSLLIKAKIDKNGTVIF